MPIYVDQCPSLYRSFLGLALLLIPLLGAAQGGQERQYSEMKGYVNKPGFLEATPERLKSLKLPMGFVIEKWAEGFEKPRMLAVGPQGQVYVSDPKKGEVLLLQDSNKDGKSDARQVVMQQDKAHGLAVHQGQLYVVTVREVFRAPIQANGSLGTAQKIIDDLPDGGQHPNRTLYFGPDGKMYITVGSTCNACDEPNEEAATILQFNADGSGGRIWAKGLRNTIGMDWHPQTRQLWGMDHGIDWFGDDESKEELNLLEEGKHYGWPYIYEKGTRSPKDTPEEGWEAYSKKVSSPALLLTAHSAPMDLLFYTGSSFPAEYRNHAFVSLHGSWNRSEPSGYKIVRIRFENGQPREAEEFISGFLLTDKKSHIARPCGMAQLPDGSLLLTDDGGGVIYRISYKGS